MASGSFSTQLQSQRQQQQTRMSRTERKSLADKQRKSVENYNALRSEAEKIQRETFVDKPNDPFTLDDYSVEYAKLSPEIKQFFATPDELKQEQSKKIQDQRDILQKRISETQAKVKRAEENRAKYEDWARRSNVSNEDFQRQERQYELEIDEYNQTIDYANQQAGKINEGAYAGDVFNWAEEKASVNRQNRESRDRVKQEFKRQIETGKLDKDLATLGLKKQGLTYDQYVSKIETFNFEAQRVEDARTRASKIGYENLPQFQKDLLNQSAQDWQKKHPSEKLVFDKAGNVVGVESGILKKTLSIDEYNKISSQSKTPEQVFNEWMKEREKKPYYLDVRTEYNAMPYETRGSSGGGSVKFYPITPQREVDTENTFFEKAKKVYSNIMKFTPDIEIPLFSIATGGRGAGASLKVKEVTKPISEELGKASETTYQEMISATPKKKEIDIGFQEEYQNRFEDAYMKKLIYGEIDFDTASKEFGKSDTANVISQKYSTAITEDTKKMMLLEKWKYGTKLAGLGLGKEVVDFIPTNYGDLAVKSALIYTGVSAIKYVPPVVSLGLEGGFFAYGSYKAFSPTSTPSEAGSGLITAGISGISLGYTGYRYLRSPVIKTKPVTVKKSTMYATGTIGKDLQITTDSASVNKVVYGQQKLSQNVQMGRRTIVTSKWRDLMNRYLGTNIKNIYEGIPTQQTAVYGTDIFRGTRYVIKESAYQTARKKLLSYGYSESQSRAVLRYYAPRITEQWMKRGIINVGDMKASGEFLFETRKPVIAGEQFGVKTRGGRTLTDAYKVERKIIEMNDQAFVLENKAKVSAYLNKRGNVIKVKDVEFSKALTKVGVSDLKEGYEWLGDVQGVSAYKYPAQYKDIYSLSGEYFSMKIIPKRKKTIVDIITNQKKYDLGKATLFEGELDLRTKGSWMKVSKSVSEGTSISDVEKVVNKISDQKAVSVLDRKRVSDLSSQLKTQIIPRQVYQTKLKELTGMKTQTMQGMNMGLVSNTMLRLKEDIKYQTKFKTSMKEMTNVDQVTSQLLKNNLKTTQALKNATTQVFETPTFQITPNVPRFKTPTIIETTPYKPPVMPKIMLSTEKLKQLIKIRARRKTPDIQGLFPDFTSKAFGLAPKKVSVKQALREIQKIQTGFEVRTGAKIKSEKDLMEGIMK